MAYPRCTRHPEHRRRNGRCMACHSEANSRYVKSCIEARHTLRRIQAAMAS